MTSTLTRTEVETTTPVEPAAPEKLTFTVGTVTIEAKSEQEALRKYKRMVRSEGLKAKADMDWCVAGTNERLERLGVRRIGEGVPVRVLVTASRTMYLTVDADDDDEAQQMLAEGDEYLATLAKENMPTGWKVTLVEAAPPREGEYKVGDADDTLSNYQVAQGSPSTTACEHYSSRHGYCTRPRGHVEAGDRQHARGNGVEITNVWKERAPRVDEPGEQAFQIGSRVPDGQWRAVGHCVGTDSPDGWGCNLAPGHSGHHVGTYDDQIVHRIWDADGNQVGTDGE